MRRMVIVSPTLLLVASASIVTVSCSILSARVQSDRVHARIVSNLTQNMTNLFEGISRVSGASLSDATHAIERQIRASCPQASLKDLSIQFEFTNNTVEIQAEFDVLSVVSNREEVVLANLAWRAFSILDDLEAEKVHYNLVGRTYFRSAIAHFENMTRTVFYENRTFPATRYRALDIAGNVTMLRFSALGQSLSKWERTYDVGKVETSYILKAGPTLDLAARRELDGSALWYGIWMDLVGEITVSGHAGLNGDMIESETRVGVSQILMVMAVVTPLLVTIMAHLGERRRTRMKDQGRRR